MSHFLKIPVFTILPLYFSLGCCGLSISPAIAQLLPDDTLGEENSVVTPNVNIKGIESDRIDGGAQRGGNLFHSFQEFNVQRGRGVYYSYPDRVANILTRITGNNASNILGTLGVLGNANLFFINPNGIIFGPDAKLDIEGSFYGATADSILFENGFEFVTSDSQAPPLLTVNVPIGLRLPENPGSIQVEGRGHNLSLDPDTSSYVRENRNVGLQVPTGQTLALIGGDIFLTGGNLTAEKGSIELGSVRGGVVGITATPNQLSYGEISAFGNIQLSQASSIDVSGAGAGATQIQGRYIEVQDGSTILAYTLGSEDGKTSSIRASESIEIGGQGSSGLFAEVVREAEGNGGSLRLEARSLQIQDGAQIVTATFGQGDGGDITISTTDLELIGTSADGRFPSGLFASVGIGGEGRGGDVRLETESLQLQNGARIGVDTFGQEKGGDLIISATNISLTGTSADGQVNQITAALQQQALGDSGDITLNTRIFKVEDGSQITAGTRSQGDAGDLIIRAKEVQIIGRNARGVPSRLTAAATSTAEGRGGELIINAESLEVKNEAEIRVSSATQEPAGNLQINSNNILLSLNAETTGGQGSITINNNKDLILRHKSNITTNATGAATGGNIEINTENLVALENSDISANAQAAFGGTINITAAGIFGTEFRPQQTNNSDITATSELGASFSGEVTLNTPEVDPSDGLVQFDDTIEDISTLIDQNPCQRGEGSEFTITGQGGLPPSPRDFLSPDNISQEETSATPENIATPSQPEFIEAQGWVSTPNGIQLIVNPNTAIPVRPWLIPPNCEQLDSQQLQPYLLASTTDIIPSPNSQPLQVTIQQFNFQGNTKFSNEELQQQLTPYLNQPIAFHQLIAARTTITEYYTKNNYITSGAFIPPQIITENGTVTIQVVEGKIDEIDIKIEGRLKEDYIKSRLEKATIAPINQEKLLSTLQLLQLDPLIDNISAELSAGVRPDTSVLAVEVVTANPWQIAAISNNGRVPSVGTFRRGIEVGHGNLTGMGDSFNTLYTNTDGSDIVELSYAIPVNSRNGRIEMFYRYQDNEVIESPFERLDIESNSHTYELTFRQPIIQTPRQEFSLGLGATKRDSQTSLLGENFPLSEGANDDGETKLSILRFFQDYQLRGDNQVLALNSQFNIGLGILDATVNSNAPDSRFFYWRGQGQWVRSLATDTLLVVGADVQLSPSDLVPLERFGLGGYRSVRGYRQDTRLTDNGALGTVELRLPVPWISGENRLFQVVPFIDGGVAWNSDGEEVSGTNALAAVGVGLQVKLWDKINMRLDYGIPLIDVDSRDRTAQEDGFYFSVSSSAL